MSRTLVAAAAIVLAVAGCGGLGGDSPAKVTDDMLSTMDELNDILEGVSDEATAQAAVARIDGWEQRMDGIFARLEKMRNVRVSRVESDRLSAKMNDRGKAIGLEIGGHLLRLQEHSGLSERVVAALVRMQESANQLRWQPE